MAGSQRACLCGKGAFKGRLCNQCAEAEFTKLASSQHEDDEADDDNTPIVIEPRASGREGFHPGALIELPEDDERPRHSGRIRGEKSESALINPTALTDDANWRCSKCGPLSRRYPPLIGGDGNFHCSSLDCDEVVERV